MVFFIKNCFSGKTVFHSFLRNQTPPKHDYGEYVKIVCRLLHPEKLKDFLVISLVNITLASFFQLQVYTVFSNKRWYYLYLIGRNRSRDKAASEEPKLQSNPYAFFLSRSYSKNSRCQKGFFLLSKFTQPSYKRSTRKRILTLPFTPSRKRYCQNIYNPHITSRFTRKSFTLPPRRGGVGTKC